MNFERPYRPEDLAQDTEHIDHFFEGVSFDERLDQAIELYGEAETHFSFQASTRRRLHPSLPPTAVDEFDRPQTSYTASGKLLQNQGDPSFALTITGYHEGPQHFIVEQQPTAGLYFYQPNGTVSPMPLAEFADFTLRAANLKPRSSRQVLSLFNHPQDLTDEQTLYNTWLQLAEQSEGRVESTGVVERNLQRSDTESLTARVYQHRKELPHSSTLVLTIERSIAYLQLDAEDIYRLELTYESHAVDGHISWSNAERQVIAGCDPQLIRARIQRRDPNGKTTELNTNDRQIIQDFRSVYDLAINGNR